MLYWLAKLTSFCFFKLFFNIELKGQGKIPSKGPFILAANHLSYFDPPLVATFIRCRICFLAKEELFRNWIGRICFSQLGAIPLKRQTNDFRAMRLALALLNKKPLLIFPQGVIKAAWDDFHAGVGFLARQSSVPVMAARIYGAQHILPLRECFRQKKKIKIVFDWVDNIQPEDNNQIIANKVMEKIKSL